MILDNNNHSVFVLRYDMIMTTHHRKEIINEEISQRLREIFNYISPNYNITLIQWDFESDYLEIQFRAHPNTELAKFINAYKSAGSRLVKKEYPEILENLIDGQFWSKSFFLMSLGEIDKNITREYLESQNPGIDRRRRDNRETMGGM